MLAVLIFFAIDGHLVMLRLLQLSFVKLPPGTGVAGLNIGALIAYFGSCFVFGFAIVAPIVLGLFVVDLGVAFMSRTMPQMNVFVMSMALKVIVGLMMLAICFAGGLIQRYSSQSSITGIVCLIMAEQDQNRNEPPRRLAGESS